VSAAVWQAVVEEGLHPIAISYSKLYGTWGDAAMWRERLLSWLPGRGIEWESHHLLDEDLPRVWFTPPSQKPLARAVRKLRQLTRSEHDSSPSTSTTTAAPFGHPRMSVEDVVHLEIGSPRPEQTESLLTTMDASSNSAAAKASALSMFSGRRTRSACITGTRLRKLSSPISSGSSSSALRVRVRVGGSNASNWRESEPVPAPAVTADPAG